VRFALKSVCENRRRGAAVFSALVVAAMFSQPAFAVDGVFIQQAGQSVHSGRQTSSSSPAMQPSMASVATRSGVMQPTPETALPATGGNFASTIEMGQNKRVFQAQAGAGNSSNVGIINGKHDDVNVLQGGRDQSNLLTVNTQGLTVDVIQPNGTAPINVLIARLPNGVLDVVQPSGSPPVSLMGLPNGVLLIRR
jgi:hypothetical protein